MLILPLIDLLILAGSLLLGIGSFLKLVAIATVYRPTFLGFSSIDFVTMTAVCWGFALVLAARAWVQLNEPSLLRLRQQKIQARGRRQAEEREFALGFRDDGEQERSAAGGGE